ncbi:MAG: hypothetical protein WA902_06985 [Thermosynechococcaceae cyanobacterium]
MSDQALLQEVLRQIEEAINRIERRFVGIQSADDFTQDDAGLDKLDGIAMMLIWMGESLKNLEKYGGRCCWTPIQTLIGKEPKVPAISSAIITGTWMQKSYLISAQTVFKV